MSDVSPLLSFLGGSGTSNSQGLQRTVGTAATVGLGLTLLRLLVSATDMNNTNNTGDDNNNNNDLRSRSEVLYHFVKSILRRMLVLQGKVRQIGNGSVEEDDDESEDNVPIIHSGACHCRSVQFELIAPRKVDCKEARPGKIQYRHARVRARSFRFIKGASFVNMYYVNKSSNARNVRQPPKGNDEVGAHSFCSRCGVHFLHAPNSHSAALDVNVDCLETKDIKLAATPERVANLALGSHVLGQWDSEGEAHGYPATISEAEENPPPSFPHAQNASLFGGYDTSNHPLMRHNNNPLGLDSFDDYDTADNRTIDLVFPGSEKMDQQQQPPGTPSTVRTSQTGSFQSGSLHNGVPPTLTLDTRDYNNDLESVISMTSARSCFPALSSNSNSNTEASPHAGASTITPTATALARLQMQKYMKKHMSSSSTMSSSASLISPASRGGLN